MLRLYQKAHWSLSLSISVFLLLDVSVLAANFWLSHQIDRDATAINLAGRQRMLSQDMAKTVLTLRNYGLTEQERAPLSAQLLASYALFNDTLEAFERGGEVLNTQGNLVSVGPLNSSKARQLLGEAKSEWPRWQTLFSQYAQADPLTQRRLLAQLERYALDANTRLLGVMNRLTTTLEHEAQEKTAAIRLFQSMAMLLALLNFAVIIMLFYRHIEAVRRNNRFLDKIIDKIDSSVLIHRKDGQILSCNEPACQLFGTDSALLEKLNINDILQLHNGELMGLRRSGGLDFYAEVQTSALEGVGADVCISTVHDVTGQKELQTSLHHKAYHDPLTELPNRLLIFDRLNSAIARARRYGERFTLFFIDLDGFKAVNDGYGHEIGDALLLEVTACLKRCIRETDTLGRLGGDEFVMILSHVAREDNAIQVARKVIQRISEIKQVRGLPITISASVGVAMFPEHGNGASALMKQADQAMYLAKKNGKNGFRVAEVQDELISIED